MVLLTQLPREIVQNILGFADPEDLAPILLTCRFFYYFVRGNKLLCKSIYLRLLDSPPAHLQPDWEATLHDLVKLRRICASTSSEKTTHLPFVFNTVTHLLALSTTTGRRRAFSPTYPPSRNAALLGRLFDSEHTRDAFLSRSSIFDRARAAAARGRTHSSRLADDMMVPSSPHELHQLSAKLHCLHGTPVGFDFDVGMLNEGERGKGRRRRSRRRKGTIYPYACSRVYDLRQYTHQTGWGPFMGDGSGRADWEKVEAVMLVLRTNLRRKGLDEFPVFATFWNTPFAGTWAGSYLVGNGGIPSGSPKGGDVATASIETIPQELPLPLQDPYGVSGTWLRVVCFLDYEDFYNYNFPDAHGTGPQGVLTQSGVQIPMPALDRTEATRFILMKMRVTSIAPPGPRDGQGLPVVHFRGVSRALDETWDTNGNSDLKGTVRLTTEGEVRWTTFSLYSGQARWRSEGLQIGGVRAARGVVGTWFDAEYDPFGPCGPTAFWKLGDWHPAAEGQEASSSSQAVWGPEGGEETMHAQDWFPLMEAGGLSLDPDERDDAYEESDSDSGDEGGGGGLPGYAGGGIQVVVGGMEGGFDVMLVPHDAD